MDTKNICEICLKKYKTKATLARHVCKTIDDGLDCKYCNKVFKNKYNRRNHESKCGEEFNKTLVCENEKLKRIIMDMETHKVDNKIVINNTNTTINTNTTNVSGNVINQIIINNFGDEDISHITKHQLIKAFKMCKEFPLEMIKLTHFNKSKPENHNIYKPNFRDKYVKYFNDNVWKIGDAKKIITELYMSKMDIAEEKFEDLKEYLSDITKDRFQWLLDNREESEVMTEILKKIAEMLYNERNIVSNCVF